MATLTGNTIASTYTGLLKTSDNGAVTSTLVNVTDGTGNSTGLSVSSTSVAVSSSLTVTGSTILSGSTIIGSVSPYAASNGGLTVTSFATKDNNIDGVFVISSNETAATTSQLRFNQINSAGGYGWSMQSVNQGTGYTQLRLNPLGGTVHIANGLAASGSVSVTGSVDVNALSIILSQVSSSLDFVDDAAAAAGGVPLGGLYRNGNVLSIRLA